MKNALLVGWHYFQLASPWLITSFIPSVIVGLTKYPKAQNVFKFLLNMVSILSHKDSNEQTLKLPLTMSKPPLGKAPMELPGASAPPSIPPLTPDPPSAALVLLLAFTMGISACSAHGQVVVGQLGKCELGQLPSTMQALVADATAILVNGTSWSSELEALALQVGPGNLGCVVQAIMSSLQAKKTAKPGNAAYTMAVIHAKEYLAKHK